MLLGSNPKVNERQGHRHVHFSGPVSALAGKRASDLVASVTSQLHLLASTVVLISHLVHKSIFSITGVNFC